MKKRGVFLAVFAFVACSSEHPPIESGYDAFALGEPNSSSFSQDAAVDSAVGVQSPDTLSDSANAAPDTIFGEEVSDALVPQLFDTLSGDGPGLESVNDSAMVSETLYEVPMTIQPLDGSPGDSASTIRDTRADSAPACLPKGDYMLCGDGTGCCSTSYVNVTTKFPDGRPMFKPFDTVKSDISSQVYLIGPQFVPYPARAILQWTSSCTDMCIYASPPSANGCSTVRQYTDVDIQAILESGFTIATGTQVPFRPGTVILVYNGEKYVAEGQGQSRVLHKLNPPSLGDKIFPGTAAAREQVVDGVYVNMYKMGTDITDVSQYDPNQVCKQASSVSIEYM